MWRNAMLAYGGWMINHREAGRLKRHQIIALGIFFPLSLFSYVYLHLGKVEQILQILYMWSALEVNNM